MTYKLRGLRVDCFAGLGADWAAEQRQVDRGASDARPGVDEMVARWYRSVGNDNDALHRYRQTQSLRRQLLLVVATTFALALVGTCGYGYQSWRAAGLLVAFYLAGFAVFSQADMPLARAPEVYAFDPLMYTADELILLIDWKQAAQCAPDTTGALWWL